MDVLVGAAQVAALQRGHQVDRHPLHLADQRLLAGRLVDVDDLAHAAGVVLEEVDLARDSGPRGP